MKTPREILNEHDLTGKLKCYDYEGNQRDYFDITYAMKEYAKMWIDRAAEVENRTEYITDGEWILRLKKEIDAQ